ncbi:MAG: sulfatase-like hydrolase/transferase [Bradymonadia bacterium]
MTRLIFLCCFGFVLATIQGSIEWLCLDHASEALTLGSFITATALSLVTGLHFGAIFAMLYVWSPKQWLKTLLSYLRLSKIDTSRTHRLTGYWLALLIACGLAGLVNWFSTHISHQFIRIDLARGFATLSGVASMLLCLFVFSKSQTTFERILAKLAPKGTLLGLPLIIIPLSVSVLACILILTYVTTIDLSRWSIERFEALGRLGIMLIIALGWYEDTIVRCNRYLITLGLVLGLSSFSILWQADNWGEIHHHPSAEQSMGYLGLSLLRHYADRDGDGHAGAFGGRDCDDRNARVGPHAIEIPGDGIDNNCRDGDAAPTSKLKQGPPTPRATADAETPQFNVVFVLIDTVRASHLSLYGYHRATSPNLDRWATQATVFERAYAQAPNTPRSIPSILTGRYPSRIHWQNVFSNYSQPKLDQDNLLDAFKSRGWQTEGISAHWYFEKVPQLKQWATQWDNRGFMDVTESYTQITSPEITKRTVQRLNELSKDSAPFFLFTHYFDPHSQYHNHREYVSFKAESSADYYDTELTFTDHHLAPLLKRLDASDLVHNTIVIITSDHGEAFGEHGYEFHGRTLFEEEIRTPLIIRHPNIAPRRISSPVGLVDLFATIDHMQGGAERRGDGHSLVPLMQGDTMRRPAAVFSEQLPYPSFKEYLVAGIGTDGSTKVIYDLTGNRRLVFDLKTDHGEQSPLSQPSNDRQSRLDRATSQFIEVR